MAIVSVSIRGLALFSHSQFPATSSISSSIRQIKLRNRPNGYFNLYARYSPAQDISSTRFQDNLENLPKLVEDVIQTSISTGPRGALRLVQGLQAVIGVGGEWVADISKDLDTEIIVAAAREANTNATAVSANVVFDERQMNALFLDVIRVSESYGLRFPREFALLMKQLLYFDRYTRLLAPNMNMLKDQRVTIVSNRPNRKIYS